MNTSLILALALGFTAVSASLASEPAGKATNTKSARQKPKIAAPKPAAEEKAPLTGSYIHREIRRSGTITDGLYNVAVIDSEMIKNSGVVDLRGLLVRHGFGR